MNRRRFIKRLGLGMPAMAGFPYVLPTGRLFAPTGKRLAKHVVFCLYAGGIRNYESILKREGNLMPHLLDGDENWSVDIREGMDDLPLLTKTPLQRFGTLFKGFRYNSSVTLHYTGHAAALTGNYCRSLEMMREIPYPTVFEYFRKFGGDNISALKTWWVSDQAGPFPFLNSSGHPDYGPKYGANFIQPSSFFETEFGRLNLFSNEERESINKLTSYFNQRFKNQIKTELEMVGIRNSDEERYRITEFVKELSERFFQKGENEFDFWGLGGRANGDIVNMFSAIQILEKFNPELLVVNMQKSDIGHSNFTKYCDGIKKSDLAVYKLWEAIQSNPNMKDDTVLIIAPEFGRNEKPNSIRDPFGRLAVDHTGDETSKQIFCLVVGPPHIVQQNKIVEHSYGESIDIVPTIGAILGFGEEIPRTLASGVPLHEAFVQ